MVRIAADVAWVRSTGPADDYCLLARVPEQKPIQLSGSAVDLWLCWADGQSLDQAVDFLSSIYSVPAAQIRSEAGKLFRKLVDEGYLETQHPVTGG